ncbi:MAG TPA: glycosyltransferase [Methylomirabilota bacterium]|nr:glycosyltransferase [Methylomirabilota bacterium]
MLTVLIATRNGAATLPRVLASHARLRPPPGGWRLVVIDNGSTDGSARIVRSFAGVLPLIPLSEPRRGKNRALNAGLPALEGDLAVFSDDDAVPEPDWLVALRRAADAHPEAAVFGGPILPLWSGEPAPWVREWVRPAPVFGVTDPAWPEGPCDPTRVWGANMAIRAGLFARGHRFDERIGPDGSARYAMGGETELTLRLAIAEQAICWHCRGARVHHLIAVERITRASVLRRAFRVGRCGYRESRQKAAAGRPHVPRGAPVIGRELARALARLAGASATADPRAAFEARWQLNLWLGCLAEAAGRLLRGAARATPSRHDVPRAGGQPAGRPASGGPPTVTVVLPTYQRASTLERAIRSVLEQTYRDFELIVVDDGSTDGTGAALARVQDPRVVCIRLEANRGASAARNVGIRAARGQFLAFQDSDDEWLPSKLERHLAAFEAHGPEMGVVYSDMERIWQDGRREYHRSPAVVRGALIDPRTGFYQVCRLGIQSAVIRRECVAAVGGFDEAFPALEDLELFVRLSRRYAFHHLEVPLVRYYETPGGLSANLAAKLVARRLLLARYGPELEQVDLAFVRRESRTLQEAERRRAAPVRGA